MNEQDIRKLLGLSDKPKPFLDRAARSSGKEQLSGATTTSVDTDSALSTTLSSPTVLKLDEWDLARGEELFNKSRIPGKSDAKAFADFYNVAFDPEPEFAEHTTEKRRQQFLKNLIESPEYQQLHCDTKLDVVASRVACVRFAQEFSKLQEQDKRDSEKPQPNTERQRKKAENQSQMHCLFAASQALQEAQEEIDEVNNMLKGLGMKKAGQQEGLAQQQLNPEEISKCYQKIRDNALLRQIFNEAGKMRSYCQGKQREKQQYGYDDMIGIVTSDDPSKILASELMLLDDSDLGDLTLMRLVDKECLARQWIGLEPVGLGPMIFRCDESGSMGSKIIRAKALCLTGAWLAQYQKRWCCLQSFSYGMQTASVILRPGKWDQSLLLDWLCHNFDGGTSYHIPLDTTVFDEMVKMGMPKGRADLIVVTDGEFSVPKDIEESFKLWKKKSNCRLISLMIDAFGAGGLANVSDEFYNVSSLDCSEKGVSRVFSL